MTLQNSDRLCIATEAVLDFGSIQDTAAQSLHDVGVSYNLARKPTSRKKQKSRPAARRGQAAEHLAQSAAA